MARVITVTGHHVAAMQLFMLCLDLSDANL